MKLAIMQPYLFPYIGYFQLMHAADKFVVYDDVNYIKKGWINRNSILINKQASLFTIPLKEASQNKLIKDIFLSDDQKWRNTFLKSVLMAYRKAPHFAAVYEMIERIVRADVSKLVELARISLESLNAYMGIHTAVVPSSEVYQVESLKGQDRILAICRKEQAGCYINPSGGQSLYSKELFEENGIKLDFLQSRRTEYQQFDNEFVSWLSIIDVLMFNDKDEIRHLLDQYEFI